MEDRTLLSSFVVSNTGDSGPGSLRQAILDANAQGGAETITFDPTAFATPQTITLTSGQLELSDPSGTETITGPAAGVTVSGGGQSRVFQVDNGVTASISGLTITGGHPTGNYGYGGGLFNLGTTTLTNCTVSGNSAARGGGVSAGSFGNLATTTLINCTVSGNSIDFKYGQGGGLFSYGTTTLTNCTVSGNSAKYAGGGLYNYSGTATLTDCTVSGNTAPSAGGLDSSGVGAVAIGNTIVAANGSSDVLGVFASQGYNLIGETDGSTGWVGSDLTGTSATPLNPLLAPLGNYGGPTQTMALLPDSPAIQAGRAVSGITTDQRGQPLDMPPDIGAYQNRHSGPIIAAVTTTADSGPGSLRQAILDANALSGATVTIDFAIPGSGVQTVAPLSALPAITNAVLIDGDSQPGYSGTPLIEISGSEAGGGDGLTITGSAVTVRGLDITNFSQGAGIHLTGTGATGDWIYGDFLGTDPTGTRALPNQEGVAIDAGASDNTIGTNGAGVNDAPEQNILSGNVFAGVWITGQGTSGNTVAGNLFGTDLTGTAALGNAQSGVYVAGGASSNTIAGNLITDNSGPGVVVGSRSDDLSVGNAITDNRIYGNTGQAIDLGDDGVTYHATATRVGPNNYQNFPIIVSTASGQLEGWLGGSLPDTTFRVDFFASATFGPRSAGEAEDYLGSLQVTTDSQGQAVFDVPYSPPAGLPVITATATDPQGNTSEVSAQRRTSVQAPEQAVRQVPGEPVIFSSTSGDGIVVYDRDAGPIDPTWSLTLAVGAGTLTLSSTAGLTGSGNGTDSLSYRGPLSAVNAALEGLRYIPSPQSPVFNTLSLLAQSEGAATIQADVQIAITNGILVVSTRSDSGPGSLRQAILDSNALTGGTNTIDFAVPGQGLMTIALGSTLPPITTSVLIDGTTQPGYAGIPLIALGDPEPGSTASLAISGGNVTIRGLVLDTVAIDPTTGDDLAAVVHPQGTDAQLSLLGSQGQTLAQSDGLSAVDPDAVVDEVLGAGNYLLRLESADALGAYTWTTMLAPASPPVQPLAVGLYPIGIVAGDFTGDGRTDLAVANSGDNTISVLLGNGDGTFAPQVTYAVGSGPEAIVAGDLFGDGHLDLATANYNGTVSVLLGNGDGTFAPQVTYAVGPRPDAIVAGDFTGNGRFDLAVVNGGSDNVSILMGNGDGTFAPQVTYAVGSYPDAIVAGDFTGNRRIDLAVTNANDGTVSVLLGNGDGTFAPQVTYAVGSYPQGIVAGDFTGNGRIDLAVVNSSSNTVSVLLGNGDGTFAPQVTYHVGAYSSDPTFIAAGDFTADGRTDLAVANSYDGTVSVLLGNGDGTFQPQITSVAGSYPLGIVAGDFSGNGRTDLAVVDRLGNSVWMLLGNGDGTFQPQSEAVTAVGAAPKAIVAGDFTGDGRTDLAVVNDSGNTVSVLLGNGDGTFQPQVTYAVGRTPESIVTGDFNGDGRIDLAVVNFVDNSVSVLLGNGDGTFQPQSDHSGSTATGETQSVHRGRRLHG